MTLVALAASEAVKAKAIELGFERAAIGPAGPPEHGDAFERWLDGGYGDGMAYLERGRGDRLDPERLLPDARSVVAVAASYAREDEGEWQSIARYARGRDYHDVLLPRLHSLADFVVEAAGQGTRCRVALDTSAVLERDLAARAGLGWIGKNTNLLAPGLGSWFFIGIVLTTAELVCDDQLPDRCGRCTACLDACPTRAFVAPFVLDARRCISYLTIEHRGGVSSELRPALSEWIFGCDVCQEVCPWNRRVPPSREQAFVPGAPLGELQALLELDDGAFRARFRGSAIWRAKRSGLLRNIALALGNRGDRGAIPALRRALDDPDPVVRDAAAWALERLGA